MPPPLPHRPQRLVVLALVALSAGIFSVLFVFVREFLDDRVRSTEDVSRKLGMSLLGVMPDLESTGVRPEPGALPIEVDAYRRDEKVTEMVNTIRTALITDRRRRVAEARVLLVSSSIENEGRSTVAIDLAHAFARLDRVLLIDCHLQRPALEAFAGGSDGGAGSARSWRGDYDYASYCGEPVYRVASARRLVVDTLLTSGERVVATCRELDAGALAERRTRWERRARELVRRASAAIRNVDTARWQARSRAAREASRRIAGHVAARFRDGSERVQWTLHDVLRPVLGGGVERCRRAGERLQAAARELPPALAGVGARTRDGSGRAHRAAREVLRPALGRVAARSRTGGERLRRAARGIPPVLGRVGGERARRTACERLRPALERPGSRSRRSLRAAHGSRCRRRPGAQRRSRGTGSRQRGDAVARCVASDARFPAAAVRGTEDREDVGRVRRGRGATRGIRAASPRFRRTRRHRRRRQDRSSRWRCRESRPASPRRERREPPLPPRR